MNTEAFNIGESPKRQSTENTSFRQSAIAFAVAGILLAADHPARGEETTDVKALQEEVARLRKALAKSEKELAATKAAAPATPAGAPVAAGAAKSPAAAPGAAATAGTVAGANAPVAGAASAAGSATAVPNAPAAASAKAAEAGAAAAGVTASAAGKAKAAEPKALGEVVVRTRRGLRQKHDEARAVSVVTGEQLEETGAYNLSDFSKRTANLARDTGNPRTLALSIRGIGRKGITEAQDPVVLTSIDNISYAYNSLATWDQVDVDSVEVTRGPGGTLGGKNYSLGSVNIFTRRPSLTSGGRYALRLGQYDALFGDFAYGGPLIDNLLAWRGTFFSHSQEGAYPNAYPILDRTYIDLEQMSGKVQLLATPTDDITALVRVDVQPKTYQNFNGFNFYHKEPALYANGNGWNMANTAFNRLNRGLLNQLANYGLSGNQYNYYNYDTGIQYNDAQLPLGTSMQGVSGEVNWKVAGHTLTSLTGYRTFWFEANNDEGTPYDISLQGGGGVRYRQFSQELKVASEKGGLVDYVTGLYYIKTGTNVDAKSGWGSDAGAWFAGGTPSLFTDPYGGVAVTNPIQGPAYTRTFIDPVTGKPQLVYGGAYGRLTADAAGRYLLSDSLNGMRVLGQQTIRNESPAWYGTANWHITPDLTLTTGIRTTYEDRNTSAYRYITDNGYAGILNPTTNSFGVNMGGFDSVFVSAKGAGGYNALNANGQWQTFDYDKNFNPATDVNTYVVNNRIVEKQAWVKAGRPNTANSYATNDMFYTNGQARGLGTNVSNAFIVQRVGTTNATRALQPTSSIIRVPVGTAALTTNKQDYQEALRQANAAALKYFGRRTVTDPVTGVTTQAWDQLTAAQQRQIADAQNMRKGQIGVIYNSMTAEPFRKLQLTSVVSPVYRFNEDINGYLTWQYGESPGIAQIVNGVSMQAKPQTTNNYEVGLKSFLFNRTLTLNTDFFFMNIDQYQQAVQVVDEFTTQVNNDGNLYYTTATLNAPRVQAWGFEFDGLYNGIPDTSLRFAGAYTDAWYAYFPNSPLPPEINANSPQYRDAPYRDVSGYTLPGASKFMFNLGGEYRHPLWNFPQFEGHFALNYAYVTGYNADVTLSEYGWVDGFGLLDLQLGVGRRDRLFDVSLLVRNAADTQPIARNSAAGVLQTTPQWIGVVLSGQF